MNIHPNNNNVNDTNGNPIPQTVSLWDRLFRNDKLTHSIICLASTTAALGGFLLSSRNKCISLSAGIFSNIGAMPEISSSISMIAGIMPDTLLGSSIFSCLGMSFLSGIVGSNNPNYFMIGHLASDICRDFKDCMHQILFDRAHLLTTCTRLIYTVATMGGIFLAQNKYISLLAGTLPTIAPVVSVTLAMLQGNRFLSRAIISLLSGIIGKGNPRFFMIGHLTIDTARSFMDCAHQIFS